VACLATILNANSYPALKSGSVRQGLAARPKDGLVPHARMLPLDTATLFKSPSPLRWHQLRRRLRILPARPPMPEITKVRRLQVVTIEEVAHYPMLEKPRV